MNKLKGQGPFSLRLPRTMRTEVAKQALWQGISMNEFILLAVAEKIIRLSSGVASGRKITGLSTTTQ